MVQIVSETGGSVRAWNYGGGYSPYPSGTVTVSAKGTMSVHTGLSRVAAERAEIGIIEATLRSGHRAHSTPGCHASAPNSSTSRSSLMLIMVI